MLHTSQYTIFVQKCTCINSLHLYVYLYLHFPLTLAKVHCTTEPFYVFSTKAQDTRFKTQESKKYIWISHQQNNIFPLSSDFPFRILHFSVYSMMENGECLHLIFFSCILLYFISSGNCGFLLNFNHWT